MSLKSGLLEALDDLASSRSSLARRTRALDTIERLLAQILANDGNQTESAAFLQLQDGFEGNVASRLMYSISTWIPMLQQTTNSASTEHSAETDVLTRIIVQSLSILQGIAFLHFPSKAFLSKKWCIQVFIDLLATSRHLSPVPLSTSTSTVYSAPSTPTSTPLASGSIDTLLCVLVDSPAAMRAFEDADGVEVMVKILKRTGVARDIRMKCLEFLYFYLLDETGEITLSPGTNHQTIPAPREAALFPSLAVSSSPSPSPDVSPRKIPRNLGMLRKDVDFVPVTPKKTQVTRFGVGPPHARTVNSPTKKGRTSPVDFSVIPPSSSKRRIVPERSFGELRSENYQEVHRKSTQEKKELLGSLLGNVDSLVESVAKSGIWGLS